MGGGKCQAGYPTANLDWLYLSLNSATPTKIYTRLSPALVPIPRVYKLMGQDVLTALPAPTLALVKVQAPPWVPTPQAALGLALPHLHQNAKAVTRQP